MNEAVTIRMTDTHVCLRVPFDLTQVCQSLRGRWNPEWKCWLWPKDKQAARRILDAFGPRAAQADGGDSLLALAGPDDIPRPQDNVAIPDVLPGLKTKPWRHQRAAFSFARSKRGAMLAMGMGTGKSLVTVALLHDKRYSLILCPKAVMSVWPREFERHADYLADVVVLSGRSTKAKAGALKLSMDRAMVSGRQLVVVCNYDAAWREALADAMLAVPWDAVVLDESHKIKAPGGRMSRFCGELRKVAKQVFGLTGTPMPHSPLDIYAQYRAIDDKVFGRNFSRFRQSYAIMGGFGGKQVVGYKDADALRAKFLSIAFQAGRDVIELPEAVHQVVPVEIGPKARRVYTGLATAFYAELDVGEVTVANALVRLLRLQQVTGGHLKLDSGAVEQVDGAKQEALEDLLEGMGPEPCVVFCRFTSDIGAVKLACASLSLSCCELSGAANQLAEWQAGHHQVIAVQIQSGGAGVDITRSRYCIYYSLGFSLGDYDQSLARIHRPGQQREVTYYHLIAKDTVDEQVYAALDARRDVVTSIMEGRKPKKAVRAA